MGSEVWKVWIARPPSSAERRQGRIGHGAPVCGQVQGQAVARLEVRLIEQGKHRARPVRDQQRVQVVRVAIQRGATGLQ